jgi:hypothetical protein
MMWLSPQLAMPRSDDQSLASILKVIAAAVGRDAVIKG